MRAVLSPSKVKRRTITTAKRGKTDRQKIIKKLDDLVSKIIRERDGYRCVICGTDYRPQCGHLFSRVNHSTRWDLRPDGNLHCQCGGCNLSHEHDSYPFNNWYIERFGKERWDELYREHKTVAKFSTSELEMMYEEMKNSNHSEAPAPMATPSFGYPMRG